MEIKMATEILTAVIFEYDANDTTKEGPRSVFDLFQPGENQTEKAFRKYVEKNLFDGLPENFVLEYTYLNKDF